MRSLLMTAAVVTAAIALGGCPHKRPQQPVPGPQSAPAQSAPTSNERDDDSRRTAGTRGHRASEISWFQGTLEEAFSRTTCERRALIRY